MSSVLARLRQWSEGSVNRRILGAAVVVGAMTLLAKVAALAKDLFVAYRFGRGDEVDAFLLALLLPSFLVNVIAGAVYSALIPAYIAARASEDRSRAERLLAGANGWSILLLIGSAVALVVLFPFALPVLASNFSPEKRDLTWKLFLVIVPLVVFGGLATIWGGVLNALHRFALAAFSATVVSLIAMLALLLYGRIAGIYALAIGTVLGYAAQWLMLWAGLRAERVSVRASVAPGGADLEAMKRQAYTLMVGTALMGSTELVDQGMAAMLDAGSVAALGYGTKIVMLILGLGAAAIGTSVFPHFSAMVAAQDWSGVRHTLKRYGQLILFATVPLTLFILAASEWIINVVFERGAFSATDTEAVARVQALYALQIPFYLLGILGVRLLSSMGLNRVVTVIAAFNVVSNVAGNYILMRLYGVAGIALSTSIVYLLSAVLIWVVLLQRLAPAQTPADGAGRRR